MRGLHVVPGVAEMSGVRRGRRTAHTGHAGSPPRCRTCSAVATLAAHRSIGPGALSISATRWRRQRRRRLEDKVVTSADAQGRRRAATERQIERAQFGRLLDVVEAGPGAGGPVVLLARREPGSAAGRLELHAVGGHGAALSVGAAAAPITRTARTAPHASAT